MASKAPSTVSVPQRLIVPAPIDHRLNISQEVRDRVSRLNKRVVPIVPQGDIEDILRQLEADAYIHQQYSQQHQVASKSPNTASGERHTAPKRTVAAHHEFRIPQQVRDQLLQLNKTVVTLLPPGDIDNILQNLPVNGSIDVQTKVAGEMIDRRRWHYDQRANGYLDGFLRINSTQPVVDRKTPSAENFEHSAQLTSLKEDLVQSRPKDSSSRKHARSYLGLEGREYRTHAAKRLKQRNEMPATPAPALTVQSTPAETKGQLDPPFRGRPWEIGGSG